MSELKPCPFCGSDADFEEVNKYETTWSAGCSDVTCFGYQSTNTFATKKAAAQAWNTRATPPLSGDLVEKAKDLLKWAQHSEECNLPLDREEQFLDVLHGITALTALQGATIESEFTEREKNLLVQFLQWRTHVDFSCCVQSDIDESDMGCLLETVVKRALEHSNGR